MKGNYSRHKMGINPTKRIQEKHPTTKSYVILRAIANSSKKKYRHNLYWVLMFFKRIKQEFAVSSKTLGFGTRI